MATGGGVLVRLNVATSYSARKDDARRVVVLRLVVGVVILMQRGEMKMMYCQSFQYKMRLTSGASERL
jgi:hypothetical protein